MQAHGGKQKRKICAQSASEIRQHIADIVEWKNLMIVGGYHQPKIETEAVMNWLYTYGNVLKPFICNTTTYLTKAVSAGKRPKIYRTRG